MERIIATTDEWTRLRQAIEQTGLKNTYTDDWYELGEYIYTALKDIGLSVEQFEDSDDPSDPDVIVSDYDTGDGYYLISEAQFNRDVYKMCISAPTSEKFKKRVQEHVGKDIRR